jgi:hypothetical protein
MEGDTVLVGLPVRFLRSTPRDALVPDLLGILAERSETMQDSQIVRLDGDAVVKLGMFAHSIISQLA